MVKKYVFVRLPQKTYKEYVNVKEKWETNIQEITGKHQPIPMTKVFRAVISPNLNQNMGVLFKVVKKGK